MKRPPFFRGRQREPTIRFNHRIRAREVRVIGSDGQQVGVMATGDALEMARQSGLDLVEVSANADPPVCRIVDYGKFKYQEAKKEKDSRKHQHANKVKEVQLRPGIDPNDLQTKRFRAIGFLCEDMKVKVALRFRGRQMAHTEIGFEVIKKFIAELQLWGHPDFEPRLVGRSINMMISPLPRNKRAPNPREGNPVDEHDEVDDDDDDDDEEGDGIVVETPKPKGKSRPAAAEAADRGGSDAGKSPSAADTNPG